MIDVRHCSISMGGVTLLDDISVTLNDGETIGIVGKSGAGKTALMKAIAGRMPGLKGEITVNGSPLPSRKTDLDRTVCYSGQALPGNPDETVREFLLQGRMPHRRAFRPFSDYDRQTVDEYAELLDLSRLCDERIGALPDGALRRSILARALIGGAHAVLMDNPTGELDLPSVRMLKKAIARHVIEGNRIAVIGTGDLNFIADMADRVLVMEGGRIAETGPVDILNAELIRRYFGIDVIISRNIYNGRPQVHAFPDS